MNYLKTLFYSLIVLFILLVSFMAFLLTTTPGIYTLVKITNMAIPGQIKIQKPKGQLLDAVSFKTLTYTDDTYHIEVSQFQFSWDFRALFRKKLNIKHLRMDKLNITIQESKEAIEDVATTDFAFPQLPLNIHINDLSVKLIQITQLGVTNTLEQLHLRAHLDAQQWVVDDFRLAHEHYQYKLHGHVNPQMPYNLSAKLQLQPVHPDPGLHGNIQLSGDWQLYHWQGQFKGPVEGTLHGTLNNGTQLYSKARWQKINWAINDSYQLAGSDGHVIISGTLPNIDMQAKAHFSKPVATDLTVNATVRNQGVQVKTHIKTPQGDLHGTLHYNDQTKPVLSGEIKGKALNLNEYGIPLKALEFNTVLTGESLDAISVKTDLSARYHQHLLRANVDYSPSAINANVALGANRMNLQGTLPYNLKLEGTLPNPSLLHPALQGLQTTLSINGFIKNPSHGNLDVFVNPGTYTTPDNDALPALSFKGGRITLNLNPEALSTTGALAIDEQTRINFNVTLPKFRLDQPDVAKQPLRGQIRADIDSLAFLSSISEAVQKTQGRLNLNLNIQGNLQKPDIDGHIRLTNGSVFVPQTGLTFAPVTATLETQNKQWSAHAELGADGQTLLLKGKGRFAPNFEGQLSLDGSAFPVMNTAEYSLFISPDIAMEFDSQTLDIQGSILVPKASLKPISFSDTVNLTDDAVFINAKKEQPSPPFNITTNIEIKMGDDVALDIKGLHGFLTGQIRLRQKPGAPLLATGGLGIRDGAYKAYGQNLALEDAQLLFGGGMITNPGIRIRAVRTFKTTPSNFAASNNLFDFDATNIQDLNFGTQTKVGIEVTGRVNSPEVKLFSVPSNLSQADILSMIILGKPASQANQAGGQLLLTAISSMNLDSGTKGLQLLEQLKQVSGLEFDLQSTSQYDQDTREVSEDTSLVIGKSLTNRLHLSYNIGLFHADSNVLTLKYLLNKFFSIQVTASDVGSGLDFIYTRSKE